jgi:hypothetical protein
MVVACDAMGQATMKQCKKCKEHKPMSEFYVHKAMGDGHLSFCKPCVRARVGEHREENIGRVREYDRERSKTKERRAHITRNTRKWRTNNPEKYRAQTALNNAIRDGKIKRQPCKVCGEKAHAHHDDYSKPLEVIWLCAVHHAQAHKETT